MKQQIRVGVFETNSSSEHSLTLMKVVDKAGDIGANMAAIPANTTYEFCNKKIYNMEYESEDDTTMLCTEQDKLALCIALCEEMYEIVHHKETGTYYWDYRKEMEEKKVTLHDVVKDKPFFKDVIQAVKEERNTDLVLIDAIYTLSSQSGEIFRTIIHSYKKVIDENINNTVKFFKDVIFGEYSVQDEWYCTD